MAGFYITRYVGSADSGFGAIYIGHGVISGVDAGNGRYSGSYTEQGGRIAGQVTISFPTGGVLVTGQQLPPGGRFNATFDWPESFADGSRQRLIVLGMPVEVTFEKVSDLP